MSKYHRVRLFGDIVYTYCTSQTNTCSKIKTNQLSQCHQIIAKSVTWVRTAFGYRMFTVANLLVWNSLPQSIHDPSLSQSVWQTLEDIFYGPGTCDVKQAPIR